jgi:hypothetical protein
MVKLQSGDVEIKGCAIRRDGLEVLMEKKAKPLDNLGFGRCSVFQSGPNIVTHWTNLNYSDISK